MWQRRWYSPSTVRPFHYTLCVSFCLRVCLSSTPPLSLFPSLRRRRRRRRPLSRLLHRSRERRWRPRRRGRPPQDYPHKNNNFKSVYLFEFYMLNFVTIVILIKYQISL